MFHHRKYNCSIHVNVHVYMYNVQCTFVGACLTINIELFYFSLGQLNINIENKRSSW